MPNSTVEDGRGYWLRLLENRAKGNAIVLVLERRLSPSAWPGIQDIPRPGSRIWVRTRDRALKPFEDVVEDEND